MTSRVSLIFFACMLCVFSPDILWAQDPFLRHETEDAAQKEDAFSSLETEFLTQETSEDPAHPNQANSEKDSKPKVKKFPGYGLYRESLNGYCRGLILDGRQARVQEVLDRLLKEKSDCSSCRQLYKALSCKLNKKHLANAAKVQATSPSTELLASLSNLFNAISENDDLAQVTAQNLEPLLTDLSKSQDQASNLYFEVFINFIRSPLLKHFESVQQNIGMKEKKQKQKQLESLF